MLRRKIPPFIPRCEDTVLQLQCNAGDAAYPHIAGSRAGYILKWLHCLCTQKPTWPATHCFIVSDAFWSGCVDVFPFWIELRNVAGQSLSLVSMFPQNFMFAFCILYALRLWRQYDGRSGLALVKHKIHSYLLLTCIHCTDYLVLDNFFSWRWTV